MDIIEALKSEDQFLKITNMSRWMIFNNTTNKWIVYRRKFGRNIGVARGILLIETENQELAIAELIKEEINHDWGV